jgi:hypothetical protein
LASNGIKPRVRHTAMNTPFLIHNDNTITLTALIRLTLSLPPFRPMYSIIPADPNISGVRVAVYIQNFLSFLSFLPAFWALKDGTLTVEELKTVEEQSMNILIAGSTGMFLIFIAQSGIFALSDLFMLFTLSLSFNNGLFSSIMGDLTRLAPGLTCPHSHSSRHSRSWLQNTHTDWNPLYFESAFSHYNEKGLYPYTR